MAGVEVLYKNYGILADAKDNAGNYKEAFEAILAAAKGSGAEKRLAPSFITKFSCYFPDMDDRIMNTLLDLVEDDEALVRQPAIKCLPELCKGSNTSSLCTKVADVLTQLLVSEDATDVGLVKSAMATVLLHDTQSALTGIFEQILGEDESVREKAIEYVSVPLMDMRHKLFIVNQENEKCLLDLIRKVLGDVTADEFETFVDVLGKLHHLQSIEGAHTIIDVISEQAELDGDFQSEGVESIDRFVTCFRLALKYCKKGGTSYPFVRYACLQILPVLSSLTDEQSKQSVLQLLAEGVYYIQPEDSVSECLPFIYAFLLEHVPSPPEEGVTDPPKLHFSAVECALFTLHQLLKKCPDFFSAPENEERFKEFRLRLQYFARGCQTYHNQLQAALKGKNALELKEEQNKLRQIGLKTTANINALIKDFFRNPPSYNTAVQLSWGAKKAELGTKRSQTNPPPPGAAPVKRKLSPIRFDGDSSSGGVASRGSRKQTREIYHPPRDQYSQKVSNGSFESDGSGWGTRRGRGGWGHRRGRGGRGGRRGRGGGGGWRGTWRNY